MGSEKEKCITLHCTRVQSRDDDVVYKNVLSLCIYLNSYIFMTCRVISIDSSKLCHLSKSKSNDNVLVLIRSHSAPSSSMSNIYAVVCFSPPTPSHSSGSALHSLQTITTSSHHIDWQV